MKRASVHLIFSAVALCCAGGAAFDGVRLLRAQRVNEAIAAAAGVAGKADLAGKAAGSTGSTGNTGTSAPADAPRDARNDGAAREVRLARAIALSKAGAYDTAGPLFDDLIREEHLDEVGRAALFDLGNMYLREGMGHSTSGTVQSVAMVEEAKARYRTLLRATPDDWDARYNLERALWLAPETHSSAEAAEIKEQHNVRLRGAQSEDLP
ncbi:mxaK protein [Paraburkholderia sp. GAS41]|uniref:tetratricopeptide repeat protein n=1 Tax=Paraburkholderia sp. GAS41 TaxID=3035134 RepID=UPI003D256970